MCIFFHSASGFCDSPLLSQAMVFEAPFRGASVSAAWRAVGRGGGEGWGGLSCDPAELELLGLGVSREV